MKVINETVWNTADLKRILQRAAEQEFDDGARRKGLVVTVKYTRSGGCSGYAHYHSRHSVVRIANPTSRIADTGVAPLDDPRPAVQGWTSTDGTKLVRVVRRPINPDNAEAMRDLKLQFASVACHEFAHNRGMRHKGMPNYYKWSGRWKEYVAWAADMPLTVKPAKVKPSGEVLVMKNLDHAMASLKRAETRVKRAETLRRKWHRKVRYYEQRAAACKLKGGV
jgi:hypothetical protein